MGDNRRRGDRNCRCQPDEAKRFGYKSGGDGGCREWSGAETASLHPVDPAGGSRRAERKTQLWGRVVGSKRAEITGNEARGGG